MSHRPTRTSPPALLRGTLFTLTRRCGKPTCRCASGELHQSPALAYPEGGRTKTLTLTKANLKEVRAALARYNRAKAQLDRRADSGIAALRTQLGVTRGRTRA